MDIDSLGIGRGSWVLCVNRLLRDLLLTMGLVLERPRRMLDRNSAGALRRLLPF
jgi:hypothetical protein